MNSTTSLSLPNTAQLLAEGMREAVAKLVEEKLRAEMEAVLKAAVLEATRNLVTNIESFHDIRDYSLTLQIRVNNQEVK